MQPNYPSVAKPCTSESFARRQDSPSIENKKRTKCPKVTVLKDVPEAGLAVPGSPGGILPRSNPALAPKVLQWVRVGDGVRSDKGHGERRKWPRLPLAIPVF